MVNSIESEERVQEVLQLFQKHVKNFLIEAQPSNAEFNGFIRWADQIGHDREISTFINAFVSPVLIDHQITGDAQTPSTFLDVHYVEGAPILAKPYKLPMRVKEIGEKFKFSGYVRDLNGNPLKRALIDMWHVDADGHYSSHESAAPPYNLRGRFYTDENGFFEVETIVPSPYTISENGTLAELLHAVGQNTTLPAHLNIILKRKGYETLITQVFFERENRLYEGIPSSLITQISDKNGIKEASFNFVMKDIKI